MHVHSPHQSATRALESAATVLALVLAAWSAPFAAAHASPLDDHQEASSESSSSVRTASDDELKELQDDFKTAWKSKESRAIAASLERLSAFNNPELLKAAKEAFKYKPSKTDRDDVKTEAESLGMDDKLTQERMLEVRVARVIDAAARLCVSVGDEDSVDLLVKALGDKKIWESPPQVRAVVEGLAAHRLASAKADKAIAEILYSIDADDYAGDKFDYSKPGAQVDGYDYVGKYSAAIRYFGMRRTKSFDILMYIGGLLNAPTPGGVDSPDNPPASYWEARFKTWQRFNRDAVWTLKQVTGQTWKPGYPDEDGEGEVAKAWIREHREDLGLE
ncbi:hypothetical protein Pla163_07040 [Planctomycetes bacterium Pla163]|uniref:Uncharacterized protein n=1 Tax=Rohdeia mirabilis TaxID=2528008 RepID=A0A518CWK6_9BACT|nr:hypothetical protein Pla163_07040 [Planctomycetes bacterium Pla163]